MNTNYTDDADLHRWSLSGFDFSGDLIDEYNFTRMTQMTRICTDRV